MQVDLYNGRKTVIVVDTMSEIIPCPIMDFYV